ENFDNVFCWRKGLHGSERQFISIGAYICFRKEMIAWQKEERERERERGMLVQRRRRVSVSRSIGR
ncbi:unnamed protein product, partial [Musa hybrid cultivar]